MAGLHFLVCFFLPILKVVLTFACLVRTCDGSAKSQLKLVTEHWYEGRANLGSEQKGWSQDRVCPFPDLI